ncbi:hypothetical protein [Paraburkholderia sp.]|uniref:hypothetical protein n=1 Tax=Paraburkholderia sp. TaxID=1926495 RepID=UPI002393E74C|nr:hypothetical protein [Paraburkholderia sp.]MDE1180241.1 hypothetical protein [Paraburkholderia sp.]
MKMIFATLAGTLLASTAFAQIAAPSVAALQWQAQPSTQAAGQANLKAGTSAQNGLANSPLSGPSGLDTSRTIGHHADTNLHARKTNAARPEAAQPDRAAAHQANHVGNTKPAHNAIKQASNGVDKEANAQPAPIATTKMP